MQQLASESSIFSFSYRAAHADLPPDTYAVRFEGLGLQRDAKGRVLLRNQHEITITLGASYPRMMPELTWRTPIFHPNISANGVVCLGGYSTHWVPSLSLDQLCAMLWDMIRYANYDVDSPYNREAAMWARTQQQIALPIDARPLRNRRAPSAGKAPVASDGDVVFLDQPAAPRGPTAEHPVEIVEAEVVESPEPDILFIE